MSYLFSNANPDLFHTAIGTELPEYNTKRKQITLTVAQHEWVSVWIDQNPQIEEISVQCETIAYPRLVVFNGLKDNDFATCLAAVRTNEENLILLIKNPEYITNLTDVLVDCMRQAKDYNELPTIVFFDKHGLPGVTGMVHACYELRNGQLVEVDVNWH
jgi:hypothetical protein